MINKLKILILLIGLTSLVSACGGGGGGGGGGTPPPVIPTTAQVTLSIQQEPSLLGLLEVDIKLPAGVKPASLAPGADPDTFDATGSTAILGTSFFTQDSTFKLSTNILRVVVFTIDPDPTHRLGLGSFARINCAITAGASVTAASFPTTATIATASDASLNNILTPASAITVPIGVVLQ